METNWTRYEGKKNQLLSLFYPIIPLYKRQRRGQKEFESYFKFGFVRNPWDRIVSLYHRKEGLRLKDKMTFEEFVEWFKYSSCTSIHPLPHVNQLDWFVDPHGNIMVDHIGKFETIEKDWNFIAGKIGATPTLPHINQSGVKRKHYTEYYNDKTRQIVASRFRTDIEHFEYEFGN